MADTWSARYGSVVWAKFKTFPWWPAFIIDPQDLAPTEESYKSAQKEIGKSYCVVFYGDHTTGIIKPNCIRDFNDEATNEFKGQKLSTRYQKMIVEAIAEANQDVRRPKEERFSWYFNIGKEQPPFVQPVVSEEEDEQDEQDNSVSEEETKTPGKRKREIKKQPSSKKSKKETNSTKKKKRGAKESEDERDESESEAEPEEEYDEDISIASGESESKNEKKNRGRKKKETTSQHTSAKKTSNKAQKDKKTKEEIVNSSSSMKDQTETTLERLARWRSIFTACHENPSSEVAVARSKKILQKLDDLPVTIQELKDSGVGKMINKLMDHLNPEISEPSKRLKQKWVELSKNSRDLQSPTASQDSRPSMAQNIVSSKKIEDFNEAFLSAEVKSSSSRSRAVRLFTGALKDLYGAMKFEELLHKSLKNTKNEESNIDSIRSESTTRIFATLKEMKVAETKELVARVFQDESNFTIFLRIAFEGSSVAF